MTKNYKIYNYTTSMKYMDFIGEYYAKNEFDAYCNMLKENDIENELEYKNFEDKFKIFSGTIVESV